MTCDARSAALHVVAGQGLLRVGVSRFDVSQSSLDLLRPFFGVQAFEDQLRLAAMAQAIASLDCVLMEGNACHTVATGLADLIDYARLAGIRVAPISIACAMLLLEWRVPTGVALDMMARLDALGAAHTSYPTLRLGAAWIVLESGLD
jgi:hypothetical protein